MYRLIDVVRAARAKHGTAERMHACLHVKAASAKLHALTRLAAGSRAEARKVCHLVLQQHCNGEILLWPCLLVYRRKHSLGETAHLPGEVFHNSLDGMHIERGW